MGGIVSHPTPVITYRIPVEREKNLTQLEKVDTLKQKVKNIIWKDEELKQLVKELVNTNGSLKQNIKKQENIQTRDTVKWYQFDWDEYTLRKILKEILLEDNNFMKDIMEGDSAILERMHSQVSREIPKEELEQILKAAREMAPKVEPWTNIDELREINKNRRYEKELRERIKEMFKDENFIQKVY